jgi:hypothetical protein
MSRDSHAVLVFHKKFTDKCFMWLETPLLPHIVLDPT